MMLQGNLNMAKSSSGFCLLNATEIIPQIAESQKKTQTLALIAAANLIQDLFNIHGALF